MTLARAFCAAAAGLLAAASPAALADDAGASADILGRWTFVSEPTYPTCSLSGHVVIREGSQPEAYECELVANDVCPDIWSYRATETCVAARDGDQLTIKSQIVDVTPATNRYLPDDFVLSIIDSAHMSGELRSAVISPVVFFRQDAPIT